MGMAVEEMTVQELMKLEIKRQACKMVSYAPHHHRFTDSSALPICLLNILARCQVWNKPGQLALQ